MTTALFDDTADDWAARRQGEVYGAARIRATYTELAALSGWANGENGMVTAADTGTHASVAGDVGEDGGQTPNSGYYVYSTSLNALVRVGALESVEAQASAGDAAASASDASDEADRAEAAADDAAQSAAYAGGFETPEYASQAAGNAATTPGQIFRVPIGTTPQTFNWYRRLSSGSELVDPLASAAELQQRVRKTLPYTQDDGGVVAAHAEAALADTAVSYPPFALPSEDPNGYDNIYGGAIYSAAVGSRYQDGLSGSPTANPNPVRVNAKYGDFTGPTTGTPIWAQAGYDHLDATAANRVFPVARTSHVIARGNTATGDAIGVHARSTLEVDYTGSGFGLWAYVNVKSEDVEAAHAIEVNGSSIKDYGYGAQTQLVRLALADNTSESNRFATAIQIGRVSAPSSDPAYKNNGFWCGIQMDSDSLVRSGATASGGLISPGEAIRLNQPSGYGVDPTQQYVGGIRFARPSVNNPALEGAFKYGISFHEANFANDKTLIMANGQKFIWGGMSGNLGLLGAGGGSPTTGFMRIDNGYLNVNPDASVGIAVQFRGTKVLGPRATGWSLATNTKSRSTFDTTTVTLPELAARVGQLLDDLYNNHGLIGA